MLASKFAALCFFVQVAFALALPQTVPTYQEIPPNAAKLAYDESSGLTFAYDAAGELIGHIVGSSKPKNVNKRQDAGTCANISADEIQRLDGWFLIESYAKSNWGDGWKSVQANPSDWPSQGANACVDDSIAQITFDETPQCVTNSQVIKGTITNTNGTVALSQTQGTSTSTTITVTHQNALAIGAKVTAKLEIPLVAEFSVEGSIEYSYTNTLSTANTATTNNMQTQTVTIAGKSGDSCQLSFDVQTCNARGRGQQKLTAHGWFWFTYPNQRDGHWNWAVNMDAIIVNPDQRSSTTGFTTVTSANVNGEYKAECNGVEAPTV